jgi:hypothetical protein
VEFVRHAITAKEITAKEITAKEITVLGLGRRPAHPITPGGPENSRGEKNGLCRENPFNADSRCQSQPCRQRMINKRNVKSGKKLDACIKRMHNAGTL